MLTRREIFKAMIGGAAVVALRPLRGYLPSRRTLYAVRSGFWQDASTWGSAPGRHDHAGPPTNADNVIIDGGHAIVSRGDEICKANTAILCQGSLGWPTRTSLLAFAVGKEQKE